MTDRVIVVLPSGDALVLDAETFAAALREGARFCSSPATSPDPPDEPLLDADQLGSVINVPPTWIEQKAREGSIPSVMFGRWRRFRRSEVERSMRDRADSNGDSTTDK